MQALLPSCIWRIEPAGGTQALFIFDFDSQTVLHLFRFLRFDILPKTGYCFGLFWFFVWLFFFPPVTFTSLWRKFLIVLASTSISMIWSHIAGPWNGICFKACARGFRLLEPSSAAPPCPPVFLTEVAPVRRRDARSNEETRMILPVLTPVF